MFSEPRESIAGRLYDGSPDLPNEDQKQRLLPWLESAPLQRVDDTDHEQHTDTILADFLSRTPDQWKSRDKMIVSLAMAVWCPIRERAMASVPWRYKLLSWLEENRHARFLANDNAAPPREYGRDDWSPWTSPSESSEGEIDTEGMAEDMMEYMDDPMPSDMIEVEIEALLDRRHTQWTEEDFAIVTLLRAIQQLAYPPSASTRKEDGSAESVAAVEPMTLTPPPLVATTDAELQGLLLQSETKVAMLTAQLGELERENHTARDLAGNLNRQMCSTTMILKQILQLLRESKPMG